MPPVDPTVQLTPWWVLRIQRIADICENSPVSAIKDKDLDFALKHAERLLKNLLDEWEKRNNDKHP